MEEETKKSCQKESRRNRGGGQSGLRILSIYDRALDSRDKKREELSKGESPEDETLKELTSHSTLPSAEKGTAPSL